MRVVYIAVHFYSYFGSRPRLVKVVEQEVKYTTNNTSIENTAKYIQEIKKSISYDRETALIVKSAV